MTSDRDILADPLVAWRALILYGLNTATYKIALGRCLEQFARAGTDRVTLPTWRPPFSTSTPTASARASRSS